jgi:hypothetical protein
MSLAMKNLYQIILHIVVLVLALEVVLLAYQNGELKQRHSHPGVGRSFEVGDTLSLENLKGPDRAMSANFSGSMVVAIFSSKCPFCQKSFPVWNEIASSRDLGSTRVVGISLDSLRTSGGLQLDQGVGFPVYFALLPSHFKATNRISGVPMTILITERRIARSVWVGLVTAERAKDILATVVRTQDVPTTNIH